MPAAKKTTAKKAETVKTPAELEIELATKQAELLTSKQSHSSGELTNPRVLRELRREIARIKTALNANNKEAK